MKPSQQIAEEMAENICGAKLVYLISKELRGRKGFNHWWDSIDTGTQDELLFALMEHAESEINSIKEAFPLTELIEVARAAKEIAGPVTLCCMGNEATGEQCKLHTALFALQQTEKAEWL